MIPLAALAVLMQSATVSVPPARWTAIDIPVPVNSTTLDCRFEVQNDSSPIRVLLADRIQAQRFHRGRSFQALFTTGPDRAGHFRFRVPDAGSYVLLLDNQLGRRRAAEVELTVELTGAPAVTARELSPERRRAVVAASLLLFGSLVVLTAHQFLRRA